MCSVRLTVEYKEAYNKLYDPIYELYRPLIYKSLNSTCDDSQSLPILGNSPNDAVKKWNSFCCLGPINGLSYHRWGPETEMLNKSTTLELFNASVKKVSERLMGVQQKKISQIEAIGREETFFEKLVFKKENDEYIGYQYERKPGQTAKDKFDLKKTTLKLMFKEVDVNKKRVLMILVDAEDKMEFFCNLYKKTIFWIHKKGFNPDFLTLKKKSGELGGFSMRLGVGGNEYRNIYTFLERG